MGPPAGQPAWTPGAPPPITPGPGAPFSGGEAPKRGVPTWAWIVGAVLVLVIVGALVVTFTGGDDDKDASAPDDTEQTDDTTTDDTTVDTEPDSTIVETTVPPLTLPSTVAPDTIVPGTEVPDTEAPSTEDVIAGAPDGASGTRDAPVPAGTIADGGSGWRLQVLEVVPDGTSIVMAASEFNEAPPAGQVYTLVKVALGFFGTDDPQSLFMPTITGVGPSSTELDTSCGTVPGQLEQFADAFAGAVAVGNLCFVASPDDAANLQLFVNADFFNDNAGSFLQAVPPAAPPTPMAGLPGPQPGAASTAGRTSPIPLGTATDVGDGWTLTVTGAARDITDAVAAENEFNDPPPDGFRFVGVDVTLAFDGDGSAAPFEVTTNVVDGGNLQRTGFCGTVPGELDTFTDLFAGGTASGTLCFVVPADQVGNLVMYDAPFDTDRQFFATV